MSGTSDVLNLDNQLCFTLYVCSKEIIRLYKPFLDPLGLTYTSYITMMALWEKDHITVNELGHRLFLDSGTLTPLLKKMEKQGLITRSRSASDERTVVVCLTDKGLSLKDDCRSVRSKLLCSSVFKIKDGPELLKGLHVLLDSLSRR